MYDVISLAIIYCFLFQWVNVCLSSRTVNIRIETFGIHHSTASIKINNIEYSTSKIGLKIITAHTTTNNISKIEQKTLDYNSLSTLASLNEHIETVPRGSLVVYVAEAGDFFAYTDINKRLATLAFGKEKTNKIKKSTFVHVAVVVNCKEPCRFVEIDTLPFSYFGDKIDFIKDMTLTYFPGDHATVSKTLMQFTTTPNIKKTSLPQKTENKVVITLVCVVCILSLLVFTLIVYCLHRKNKLIPFFNEIQGLKIFSFISCCCKSNFCGEVNETKCCFWKPKLDNIKNIELPSRRISNKQYVPPKVTEERSCDYSKENKYPSVYNPELVANTSSNIRTYASFKLSNSETTEQATHTYEYIDPNEKGALNEYYSPFSRTDSLVYSEPNSYESPTEMPLLLLKYKTNYTTIDEETEPNGYEQLKR